VPEDEPVRVGFRPPHSVFAAGPAELGGLLARADALGIDQVCVGDHVSFHGGQGFDGLVQATALAALAPRMAVHTAIYLLPLRHPVPVARQVASLAELAPGRLVFGVGLGGEDRHEVEVCGIDPATRGRRMDESLSIVRRLLAGESVTYAGQFFQLRDARVAPAPAPPVPILVGGRSPRAARRAGIHGDGWVGVWVTPERFAATTAEVEQAADEAGRGEVHWQHELVAWCGFGTSREDARGDVETAMERLYRTPFARFERYTPYGTPEHVAEALLPYVAAGCRSINLIAQAAEPDEAVECVAAVRRLLQATATRSGQRRMQRPPSSMSVAPVR
jgi:alkanesulfonate monooxygenase SsuD/methylene tetrahydromethanopterin reductase-like flavin-dependent oxidoreductase (luciferase family)